MKKKILLIGDLRTVSNYGAIATSTALISLLENNKDIELKSIDGRSFHAETPRYGWRDSANTKESKKSMQVRMHLSCRKVIYQIKNIKNKLDNNDKSKLALNKGIPCRYEDYHAFSKEVLRGSRLQYELALLKWADEIIFNSEGNLVHGTDENGMYRRGGLYILFLEYLSKIKLNKKCYVINHTVDPGNRDIKFIIEKLYPFMNCVYVREKMSLNLLREWGIDNASYVPDALFSYDYEKRHSTLGSLERMIDFSRPYICIGDSSGIENSFTKVKWDIVKVYTVLIKEMRNICPQIIFVDGFSGRNENIQKIIKINNLPSVSLNNCTHEQLYRILEKSKIFISGRWHASIISLLGHTPILLWGADSHKTEALYGEIDYPYRFFDINTIPIQIDNMCNEARTILKADLSDVWKRVDIIKEMAVNNIDFLYEDDCYNE